MVEKFLAKWRADITSYDGFDPAMEAMQLNPAARKVFKEKVGTMEYQLDGDTWTALAGVEGLGTRRFVYKLGEEIDGVGLDGVPLKTTSHFEDGALVENSVSQKTGIPTTIIRKVEGDSLHCTLRVNGANVEMSYKMTRM